MLIGSYSPSLVVISLFVAILASYTALDLAGRLATAQGRAVYVWMTGGALAMGTGGGRCTLSACWRCACRSPRV
ncbi:diguanylate cyclase/phosphodiesterase [Pseudomonas fluorescens]|uniref:Diguanylate cyclase/phosphodiesterase n=1 Tax=Pseudomonas fluorescens TaxID=294 RepID=A0A8B4I6A6_PSEFL|nr:diguanylate cyclase/phosphodiesterase [Pseudomonas fluorescens]